MISFIKRGFFIKKFRRKKKYKLNKLYIFLFVILISFSITIYLIRDFRFASSKKELIYYLIKDEKHLDNYDSYFNKVIYKISNILTSFDINKPETILNEKLIYKNNKEEVVLVKKEPNKKIEKQKVEKENTNKPVLYLYNTHQIETYDPGNLKDFGLIPDVVMAANLIKDLLIEKGIDVILEERSMSEYLNKNGMNYNYSYYASRHYFEDILKNNKIDMAIDLHRDALPKNLSTININNKNYAKVMFVMGCKSSNCSKNTEVANILMNKLELKYKGITRNITSRDYSYYNQDLVTPSLLIELGGNYNTTEEVLNTSIALSEVIGEYLKEIYGK